MNIIRTVHLLPLPLSERSYTEHCGAFAYFLHEHLGSASPMANRRQPKAPPQSRIANQRPCPSQHLCSTRKPPFRSTDAGLRNDTYNQHFSERRSSIPRQQRYSNEWRESHPSDVLNVPASSLPEPCANSFGIRRRPPTCPREMLEKNSSRVRQKQPDLPRLELALPQSRITTDEACQPKRFHATNHVNSTPRKLRNAKKLMESDACNPRQAFRQWPHRHDYFSSEQKHQKSPSLGSIASDQMTAQLLHVATLTKFLALF
ncbi:hypothetical protein B0J12DRAFT_668592 [Macrophomina phaseolina]|uniref:Uncharacterized protein n=1 Tax=Macrophomina phaseolina TaxID=35725 RepID=A0ABQ8G7C2_9PEZI|nr:hypothetical protein B0J12DRAFT_668592 [Macrophomina phaseolina]